MRTRRGLSAATCTAIALVLAAACLTQSTATLAQAPAETVSHNGLILNDTGKMAGDIRIRGEKIVEIAPHITAAPGAREIDATGMFLMPGIIDTHTHLELEPVGTVPASEKNTQPGAVDDLTSGSRAALAGGITTMTDFVAIKSGESPDAFADRVTTAINKYSIADMFIRALVRPTTMPPGSPRDPLTLKTTYDALVARGIASTGEDRLSTDQFDKNSLAWMQKFRASAEAGVVSSLHAEDYSILAEAQEHLMSQNGGAGASLHNFGAAMPVIGEIIAVQRGMAVAEATGAPIIIDHVSSGRALKIIEDAERRGLAVYAEGRPQYLHMTASKYSQPDVSMYLGGPPIRDKWDQDMIWDAIRKGVIHTMGTDHTGFSRASKEDKTQSITNRRMGIPNLQEYPAMMFSEGVGKERITPEQFVAVTSTNAAKIFGLYPRKGTIAVGSDADIVIWDPVKKKVLKDADQLSGAKFTAYAGTEVTGFPITTIRRGEVVYEKDKIVAQPGSGRFIAASKFQRPALRPISD
ncbi:MAG: amidohydrolase family protein [Alphaproteobacteria bacterium]